MFIKSRTVLTCAVIDAAFKQSESSEAVLFIVTKSPRNEN